MIWRIIQRFLMNDKVVDRLAESYPIRRAAQWVVYFFHKSGSDKNISVTKSYLAKKLFSRFSLKIEEKLKNVKEELEKKSKKF